MREVHHDGFADEMCFMLGCHSVRFLRVEFCLITVLQFGDIPDMTMGLDEKEKIPVWQFGWSRTSMLSRGGAHVYRYPIYGFKHALGRRRERFKRRQRAKSTDVHTVETYNIYGLSLALLAIRVSDPVIQRIRSRSLVVRVLRGIWAIQRVKSQS
ncbi:hypothetical protein Ddye_013223 [Dipteronia dyeriana]|uniref:Uncharacterized protein n=1 Tax=Dipteronia dyeriana TaxID=168575 RepID=A0AAE0CJE2_9ROSI|nr:hypothetical protein Ddye_013223 [Dipteronia dyeriana]